MTTTSTGSGGAVEVRAITVNACATWATAAQVARQDAIGCLAVSWGGGDRLRASWGRLDILHGRDRP